MEEGNHQESVLQVKCCLVLRLEFGEGHWSFQDRCIESLFTWMMMVCTQPAVAPQETRNEDLVPIRQVL